MVARNPQALWAEIPAHLRPALARLFLQGIPPGGFITAVIRNDLSDAACRADEHSLAALGYVGLFLALYPNIGELDRYPEFIKTLKEAAND